MIWLYVLAGVTVAVAVVVLAGRWQGAEAPRDEPPSAGPDRIDDFLMGVGDREIGAQDLPQVQFDSAIRGYRRDQVDDLIDALTQQLSGIQPAGRGFSVEDLPRVQFDSTVRGYRMDQVDNLLDALTVQLRRAQPEVSQRSPGPADQDDISAE